MGSHKSKPWPYGHLNRPGGGGTVTLDKRAPKTGDCGTYASGSQRQVSIFAHQLKKMGGSCNVDGNSCIRVKCDGTTGIYMCNHSNSFTSIPCNSLLRYVNDILNNCPQYRQKNDPMSGTEMHDTENLEVIVAYANCNDSPSTDPGIYQMPGPNGTPVKTCRNCVGKTKCMSWNACPKD